MAAPLTFLECTVLGIVGKFGPLTPYAVRKHFTTSPHGHFSGSAGAIYPLVERLEARGYLGSEEDAKGEQARRLYRLTRKGRGALRAWYDEERVAVDLDAPLDPLRTRMYFVGTLPPARQRAYLLAAVRGLERQVARDREDAEAYRRASPDDAFGRIAAEGALALDRARLSWLRRALEVLEGERE